MALIMYIDSDDESVDLASLIEDVPSEVALERSRRTVAMLKDPELRQELVDQINRALADGSMSLGGSR